MYLDYDGKTAGSFNVGSLPIASYLRKYRQYYPAPQWRGIAVLQLADLLLQPAPHQPLDDSCILQTLQTPLRNPCAINNDSVIQLS